MSQISHLVSHLAKYTYLPSGSLHSFLGNAGNKYSSSTGKELFNLEIPTIIWSMPICDDQCLQTEMQVLINLTRSLGGENWKNKWEVKKNNRTAKKFPHCDWYGILCDIKTKHILAISLRENKLKGKMHVKLSKLKFLLSFCISTNSAVYGEFDRIVMSMPQNLLRISFTSTGISGIIPKDIAKRLPLLSKLQLSGSKVSGEIPDSIGDLSNLTVLSLGQTYISGSVPQAISKLTSLWFLDLETLNLKGNLSFLYNLTKLKYLHLLSNEITGEIPVDIGEWCPNLIELLVPNNKLSGYLPKSIGKMKKLAVLNVEKNYLSGPIPKDLFKLNLMVLVLSSNEFTGFETCSNSTFRNLYMFMASHLPAFNCSFHMVLSYLKGSRKTILQIDISHSNIHGRLSGFIFSLKHLASLKVANNNLGGTIPQPYITRPYLTTLDLQNNDLSGSIPETFSRLTMLKELHLKGNKRLKGPVSLTFLKLDYNMKIKEHKCDTCPMVRFSHNNGTVHVDSSYYDRQYCYCDENFFGNGTHCIPCMQGGKCKGTKIRHLRIKQQKNVMDYPVQLPVSTMVLKRGHIPFPSESDVKSIHKCPSLGYYYRICVPKRNCACYINTGKEGNVVGTKNGVSIYCKKSCLCLLGHHGRYCSQCMKGYYKNGIHCYQCPMGHKREVDYGTLSIATIGTIVISVGIFYISIRRFKLSVFLAVAELVILVFLVMKRLLSVYFVHIVLIIFILGFSSHLRRCTALLKSALFYFQIMDSLVSTTEIWPKFIYSAQVYVSGSLSLNFSSLACISNNFFTVLATNLILFFLPLASIGLLWFAYYLCKIFTKPSVQKLTELSCKCRKYSIVIIDLAYFPIVKTCFSVIVGCKEIEGVSFMKRYVWIDCNSSEHISLTVIAILELIVYVIAVPLFIYIPLLCYYRNHLSDISSPMCNWLSPLISLYKPKYKEFSEVIMMLRRLSIAVLMALFPPNTSMHTIGITIVLLMAITFQATAKPFKNPTKLPSSDESYLGLENAIDIFMLSCVLLSFICVGLAAGKHGKLKESAPLITTCLCNGIFIAAFCCSVLYRLIRPGFNEEDNGNLSDLREPLIFTKEDGNSSESSS